LCKFLINCFASLKTGACDVSAARKTYYLYLLIQKLAGRTAMAAAYRRAALMRAKVSSATAAVIDLDGNLSKLSQ